MSATINGLDIVSVSIQEPRIGVWSAVVDVDAEAALSGKVTIVIDGTTWVGTVVKGDLHAGRFHGQIAGGAGKLAMVLDAKFYLNIPLSVVLTDLMLGTGETLSSATDTSVTRHTVSRWTRPQSKASASLKQVADEMLLSWRVLRDGTVWLGSETWPSVDPTYDEIDRVPGRDSLTIAPESPTVLPGCTFSSRRISRVTTYIKDEGLRQDILFESAAGGSRVSEDIGAFIDAQVGNRIDYSRLYPCKVLKQGNDGSLELLPDAQKLRGNGLTRVPIRHGIPGLHVTVPSGGKVLLFFEAGDPKLPAATLWPDGSSCEAATLTLTTKFTIHAPTVAIEGDIECTGEITAQSDTAPVKLSTHKHGDAMGGTLAPTSGT